MFILPRIYKLIVMATVSLAWLTIILVAIGNQSVQAETTTHNCAAVLPQHTIVSYTVDYAGKERQFYVLQPASYSTTVPAPLVLALHGGGGNALEWLCHRDDIRAAAEAEGFLAVYPDGLPRPDQAGLYWDAPENIPYTEYLIDWLVGHYTLDQARIYATGFSGGAQHSFELVGDPQVSRRVAAIGTVSGKIGGTGYLTEPHTNLDPDLTQGEPTSAFLVQGGLDEGVPINGEQFTTRSVLSYVIPFAEKVTIYADQLGASLQAVETITHGVTISTYRNHVTGNQLMAAVDPTLDHAWPDYPIMAHFWDFFTRVPTQPITHNIGLVVHEALLNSVQPTTSVSVSDLITFETTISNSGGASVNLARLWTITEPMPAGFQPITRPLVEALQGNVIPLGTRLDRASKSWRWQGVLGQDAVVRVRIPGRVRRCPADGVIHGQVLTLRRDPILPQRDPALVLQDVPVNGCGSLPAIEPTATHTITITEQGFVPAQLQAAPGSVVAWVNATQDWRSVTSNGWESGLLISGDSAQLHVSSAGTLLFRAGDHTATLVVREATQASKVFLPVVSR